MGTLTRFRSGPGIAATEVESREAFRQAFDGFDFDRIAAYSDGDVARVLATPGMIHSLSKVKAIIGNAQVFRRLRAEHGSFSAYLWSYTGGRTVIYNDHPKGDIPAGNGLSARIARDLRRLGTKYLGLAPIYLHLQTCGLVKDHSEGRPRSRTSTAAIRPSASGVTTRARCSPLRPR